MIAEHEPAKGVAIRARPWRSADPPRRILAIRLQALGDTVLTLPYLSALHRLLPDVALDLLTREEVAGIPKSVVLFDHVFELRGGSARRWQLLSTAALVPRLATRRYDVIIDLQGNDVSRLVRSLLRPLAWSEFDRSSARLAGERTRATIEAIGLGPLEVRPDLTLRRDDAGLDKLRAAGWDGSSQLVILNPAGSFAGRSWPLDSYVRFAELWRRDPSRATQFVVLGLSRLAPKSRYLKERLAGHLLDLVGRTSTAEAFALVRRAALVLSEDSGLMHMAWVAGVPTLALFGASRGSWARPHGSYADWVNGCEQADGTCFDGRCRRGSPTCLEHVVPEDVAARARALLESAAGAPKRIYAGGTLYAPPLNP